MDADVGAGGGWESSVTGAVARLPSTPSLGTTGTSWSMVELRRTLRCFRVRIILCLGADDCNNRAVENWNKKSWSNRRFIIVVRDHDGCFIRRQCVKDADFLLFYGQGKSKAAEASSYRGVGIR